MNRGALSTSLAFLLVRSSAGGDRLPEVLPQRGFEPQKVERKLKLPSHGAGELRDDALARAIVWRAPTQPIRQVDFRENPSGLGSFRTTDEVVCKFELREISGHMPKFHCVFEDGEILKVKYDNREAYTETAASRLLLALGFGTDRVFLVKKVRCFGCPKDPFPMLQCISTPSKEARRNCLPRYAKRTAEGWAVDVDYGEYADFEPASIERRMPGKTIEANEDQGWGWDEYDESADPRRGGATRAERDALRLLAVFLGHWDNKPSNQRLNCLPDGYPRNDDGRCSKPFAFISDVGGTFGSPEGDRAERKIHVVAWESAPIWSDSATCEVKIKARRFRRASFGEARISEPGRQFLVKLVRQLSEKQIRDLFEGSGFVDRAEDPAENRNPDNWVRAFQAKVSQIADRPACPTR